MANYIRSGSSNFSSTNTTSPNLSSVQVDTVGQTIFVMYNYRYKIGAHISPPTWNGESFTEISNFGDIPSDEQHVIQIFYLTTGSIGAYDIIASNGEHVAHSAAWALYSEVASVAPIEEEYRWYSAGYTNPSLTVAGTGTILSMFAPQNWSEGFSDVSTTTWSAANSQNVRQSIQNTNVQGGWAIIGDIDSGVSSNIGWVPSSAQPAYMHVAVMISGGATDTITPPTNIKFGETVTVTNSGFASGAPNAGTIGGQTATVIGTSVTLPNIANVPDGTVVSDTGSQAISLTNGTESAASTITVDLPTGYIETAMTTVDSATNGTLGNLLLTVGYTLVTGDKIVIDATDGSTTNADSSYFWILPKDFTVVRAADNTAYQYTLNEAGVLPVKPELPSTLSLTGYIETPFIRQLTTSGGDAPTSWDITGGTDAASYTLSDAGIFTRPIDNDTIESETVKVTATNDAGTSDEMTITISYTTPSGIKCGINSISIGIKI